jgi:hypothetical protein
MSLRTRIRGWRQSREASRSDPTGRPVAVSSSSPANYRAHTYTPATLADALTILPVFSALTGLSQLAFTGFDFDPKPLDEGDDTQQKKIDLVKKEAQRIDARIGQVGMVRKVGTLGLIKGSFLQGAAFRTSLAEYSMAYDGKWYNFDDIVLLPGESFDKAPTSGASYGTTKSDAILPGLVYDIPSRSTRYYQRQGTTTVELDPDRVICITDTTIPASTSHLKTVMPLVDQWRTICDYGMLAARRVSVPNEIAQVDGKEIAALNEAGATGLTPKSVEKYARSLVERQGYDSTKLSIAGMRLEYPRVTMPLNPWVIRDQLEKAILDFWFHKAVLESVAQAVSVSSAPEKDLIDRRISTEREIYGEPYEALWSDWLAQNGFDLRMELGWWSWAPADQKAEAENARADLTNGLCTIDEARAKRGLPALDKKTRAILYEERRALRGVDVGAVVGGGES